jgi:pimeloyl-ACP methyl ester carboxylesterase
MASVIDALVAGPEDAPGIVLVHGTRMAGAYWHRQVAALSDRFRVVAVDLPGHGARRGEPFTHRAAVETILGAAGRCPGGAAVVLGHSLGGFLTMDAAVEDPKRLRALVLHGCSARACGPATWPYRLALRLVSRVPEARLARWNDALLRRRYTPELVEPQIAAGYGFAAIPAAWASVLGKDHAATLGGYPGPVLILNGARDPLSRLGERRFLRLCPRARVRVIPGASHLASLDRPEAFTAAVRAFAEEVFGEASAATASAG